MYQRILLLACGELPPPWLLDKLKRLGAAGAAVRIALYPSVNLLLSHFHYPDAELEALQAKTLGAMEAALVTLQQQCDTLELSVELADQPLSVEAVNEAAARFAPQLIVKPCRRHHHLEHYLLGHLDWALIRAAPAPLLLLRPAPWPQHPVVVAAVDPLRARQQPRALDDQVLAAARSLSATLTGRLELLHTYQPIPAAVILDDALLLDYERLQRRMAGEHRHAMAAFVSRHALPGDIPVHLLRGETAHEIARFVAEEGVQVTALGAVDRHGLNELLLGTTAEALLDQLDGDLLIYAMSEAG